MSLGVTKLKRCDFIQNTPAYVIQEALYSPYYKYLVYNNGNRPMLFYHTTCEDEFYYLYFCATSENIIEYAIGQVTREFNIKGCCLR